MKIIRFIAGQVSMMLAAAGLVYLFNRPSVLLKIAAWIGVVCIGITEYFLIESISNGKKD